MQGTGLGLAICKLTITMMGGDIWVDGDYKEGPVLWFATRCTWTRFLKNNSLYNSTFLVVQLSLFDIVCRINKRRRKQNFS